MPDCCFAAGLLQQLSEREQALRFPGLGSGAGNRGPLHLHDCPDGPILLEAMARVHSWRMT